MNSKKAKFILSAIIVIMCLVIGIVIYVYKTTQKMQIFSKRKKKQMKRWELRILERQ